MKDFPNTPHGNAKSALEVLFKIKALFRLLILIDDENSLAKMSETDFIETIQTTGETGEDEVGKAVHFVSMIETQTNDSVIELEERFTLPALISAVLKHKDAPEPLTDCIGDALSFMSQYADRDAPQTIEVFLDAYRRNGDGARIEVTRANGVSVVGEDEGEI